LFQRREYARPVGTRLPPRKGHAGNKVGVLHREMVESLVVHRSPIIEGNGLDPLLRGRGSEFRLDPATGVVTLAERVQSSPRSDSVTNQEYLIGDRICHFV